MCHEAWWRERRDRRDEEALQIWRDFEAIWPADAPEAAPDRSEVVRLDAAEREAVPVER